MYKCPYCDNSLSYLIKALEFENQKVIGRCDVCDNLLVYDKRRFKLEKVDRLNEIAYEVRWQT